MPAPFGDRPPPGAHGLPPHLTLARLSITYFANEFGGYRSRVGAKRALVFDRSGSPYDKPTFALRLDRAAVEFSFEKYDVGTGGAREMSLYTASASTWWS